MARRNGTRRVFSAECKLEAVRRLEERRRAGWRAARAALRGLGQAQFR